MGNYGTIGGNYSYPAYVHTWPGKVKPARQKGCGKHRKGSK